MKKNFKAIAFLLIAAMLMVVSCAPEANVEGKVEDGLVEAVIGLGRSAKDITISDNDNARITYKYKMTPAWSSVNTGAPIYGIVNTFKDIPDDPNGKKNGTYKIDDNVSSVSLGKVTPGLWDIEVEGYCKVGDADKLVLQGKASAYFNGATNSKATVFVAPVSSTTEEVSVEITLRMQDLGHENYNKIGYSFKNLNGTTVSSNNPMKPSTASDVIHPAGIKVYKATVNVKSGFNTVTFSLPGYNEGKGGITKTFLAIPGVPVIIDGSVTPAEFVEGKADIKVLSIEGGNVTVAAKSEGAIVKDQVVEIKPAENGDSAKTVTVKTLANGGTYTFTYDGSAANKAINDTVGLNSSEITRSYKWYVGEKMIENVSVSTYDFTANVAGDYNVTCVATVSFTKDGHTYNLQTSATLANVRVLEATTQSSSNT